MVASKDTMKLIYEAVKRHVSDDQMQAIIDDLLTVPGNKSFRDTIERLAALAERDR
jgi:hypothetical protein